MNPKKPIDNIAKIIPNEPNTGLDENVETTCEIIPNAGKISI
jgi:hypothetical protein